MELYKRLLFFYGRVVANSKYVLYRWCKNNVEVKIQNGNDEKISKLFCFGDVDNYQRILFSNR